MEVGRELSLCVECARGKGKGLIRLNREIASRCPRNGRKMRVEIQFECVPQSCSRSLERLSTQLQAVMAEGESRGWYFAKHAR